MTSAKRYSREQIMALDPAITLAELGRCLGVSEPVVRQMRRSGELEQLGIIVNRWGAQWRVVTASVWAYLGLRADFPGAIPEQQGRDGQGEGRPTGSGLRSVR
jgi:hypothetical protein